MKLGGWFYAHVLAVVCLASVAPYDFHRHSWGWLVFDVGFLLINMREAVKQVTKPGRNRLPNL
jgi:hypothetical protein